jgi:hypothetical protein
MAYDYESGSDRIDEILSQDVEVLDSKIPKAGSSSFTFNNAYYNWVTAIFIDIRESTKLFQEENKIQLSKMIRAFTSESLEILRNSDNLLAIGVRGDCVFAVYATPKIIDEYECALLTFELNCLVDLLQQKFQAKRYPDFETGIGMATARELVVKAGRNGVGENDVVWIGEAVSLASKLSGLGGRNGLHRLIYSELSIYYFINLLVQENGEALRREFIDHSDPTLGIYYNANIIRKDFDAWNKLISSANQNTLKTISEILERGNW